MCVCVRERESDGMSVRGKGRQREGVVVPGISRWCHLISQIPKEE